MVPFSLERRPPHAAGNTQTIQRHTHMPRKCYICLQVLQATRTELHRKSRNFELFYFTLWWERDSSDLAKLHCKLAGGVKTLFNA